MATTLSKIYLVNKINKKVLFQTIPTEKLNNWVKKKKADPLKISILLKSLL